MLKRVLPISKSKFVFRILICILCVGLLFSFSGIREAHAVPTQNVALYKYPLGSIVGNGWIDTELSRSVSQMGTRLADFEYDTLKSPLWDRTRNTYWDYTGPNSAGWYGEFASKYLWGQVLLAYTSGDTALQSTVTTWINQIVNNLQESTGYIGPFKTTDNRDQDNHGFAVNYQILAMLAYYEANPTRTDVLNAARDGILWFVDNWDSTTWSTNNHGYCGYFIIQAALGVYEYFPSYTRILNWCNDYMDWINANSTFPSKVSDYLDTDINKLASVDYHAGAYLGAAKIPALLACYDTSNYNYKNASVSAIEKVYDSVLVNGNLASYAELLTVRPNVEDDSENCNNLWLNENLEIFSAITGEAKWGDRSERVIYNSFQGAKKKDDKAIAYMARPNQYNANETSVYSYEFHYLGQYGSNPDIMCCPISSVIALPDFVSNMFMHDASGNIYTVAYGPAILKMNGSNLLTVTTNYPFDKVITMTFNKSFSDNVMVRIPLWCDGNDVTVKVNNTTIQGDKQPGIYFEVAKPGGESWASNDVIELTFNKMDTVDVVRNDLFPQMVKDDRTAGAREYVCIERGPLVFAYEVPTTWTETTGTCINTPPTDMPWYNLSPTGSVDTVKEYYIDWSDSYIENNAQIITSTPSGFMWENPPVEIRIPVRDGYNGGTATTIDLVPYGCTNLRKTYFPTDGNLRVGLDTVGGLEDTPATNFFVSTRVTPSQNATVNQLNLYIQDASGKARLGIYTDDSGSPGTLLAQTTEITLINGWNAGYIPETSISSGTNYWLVYELSETGPHTYYDTTGISKYGASTYGVLPYTAPNTPTSPGVTYSFYASGSDSSGTVHVGLDSVGSLEDTSATNFFVSTRITPSQNVTANQLNLYIQNASGKARLGIYTDNGGNPDRLLAQTLEIDLVNGWNAGSIVDTYLTGGTNYWLVYELSETGPHTYYNPTGVTKYGTYTYAELPSMAPSTPTSPTTTYSFYASGKDSSGTVHIGLDAVGSLEDTPSTNFFVSTRVTLSQNVTVNQLNLYIVSASGKARLGIYTDNAGSPGTLLAQTGEITLINGWNAGRIMDTNLTSGANYWLVYELSRTGPHTYYNPTGVTKYGPYTYGVLPSTAPSTPTSPTTTYSFYANYVND